MLQASDLDLRLLPKHSPRFLHHISKRHHSRMIGPLGNCLRVSIVKLDVSSWFDTIKDLLHGFDACFVRTDGQDEALVHKVNLF